MKYIDYKIIVQLVKNFRGVAYETTDTPYIHNDDNFDDDNFIAVYIAR